MPAKLTAAQAQQVLAALLQQIGTTTDPAVLRVLAAASKAVAAKLTDVQAQQVLAPLLQQPAKALAVRRGRELG